MKKHVMFLLAVLCFSTGAMAYEGPANQDGANNKPICDKLTSQVGLIEPTTQLASVSTVNSGNENANAERP